MKLCIVTHGGAGSPVSEKDGCDAAAQAGLRRLIRGEAAADAGVEAVVVLEDDPRFNSGTGAHLRLDGATIELDAAVMTSEGGIGAVAAIRHVKNPVRAARRVLDTPHIMLAGEGAQAFAARHGLRTPMAPTEAAVSRYEQVRKVWSGSGERRPPWDPAALKAAWNFDVPIEEALGCDTVGAVVRDGEGGFAALCSTGGASWMLQGRVGDSPLPGCGTWAGPAGAVTATGLGEEIAKRALSKTVYDWLAAGAPPQEACARGVALFPKDVPVGLIAVSTAAHGAASNREMAWSAAEAD